MYNFSKMFKRSPDKKSPETIEPDIVKESLKEKYIAFQRLLNKNNYVLELMADIEEKLSGEYLFDMQYIKTRSSLLGEGVLDIIESLNAISKGKYPQLYKIHTDINNEIAKILSYRVEVPVSDLVIPLENTTGQMVGIAGGKIAHLGEVKNLLGFLTPEGFTVSAYAFIKIMEHNRLVDTINEKLSLLSIENLEEINRVSREIYNLIGEVQIPDDLESAIQGAYSELCRRIGREVTVSVRSSALREDSEVSFAGQYATFLNVPGKSIIQKYKEVVASLFTPRAIFYYKTKGFSETELFMAVGVLAMVDAVAGGVMYTKDPNDPEADHIIINAIRGLGKWVVDGIITPDIYTVSRHPEGNIIERRIENQEKMLVCGEAGEMKEVNVEDEQRGKQCLTDEQIRTLARYAFDLEKHYGCPQDIEWAIGSDNQPYILQTRPLRIQSSASDITIPTRIKGCNILLY